MNFKKKPPRSGGGEVRASEGCEAISRPPRSSRKGSLLATHRGLTRPAAWRHIRDTASPASEIERNVEVLAAELGWPERRVRTFLAKLRRKKFLTVLVRKRIVVTVRGSQTEWPSRLPRAGR